MWEIAVFLSDGLMRRGGSSEVLRGRGQYYFLLYTKCLRGKETLENCVMYVFSP
jgi:hypothetical protein